jgi:hypothetical protein
MLKTQFPSVQHLPRENLGVFLAINFVAKNWMAKMLKMNSHLVGPPTVQFAFDQAQLIRRAQNAIFRLRRATAPRLSRHPLSIYWMTSNAFFNRSRIFAHPSGNESQINLFYAALLELFG